MRNKPYCIYPLFLIILLLSSCASYVKQAQLDPSLKDQLSEEIKEMDKKDQQYRWQLVFGELNALKADSLSKLPSSQYRKYIKRKGSADYKLTGSQYDSLAKLQSTADAANQARILQIYKSYGWPGKQLVGKQAWIVSIIMLHFPDSLKLDLYHRLKKEYKRNNIAGAHIARMYDKYLLESKKPLLYGMFDHYDTKTKTTIPPLIKDIKSTNKARRKLGLPALEKYRTDQ